MRLLFWEVLTVTIGALSLGSSFAHVLESIPCLKQWSPELWRETTVFNAQFWMFAAVAAPLDVAASACPAVLAWLLRYDRLALRFALAGAMLYAVSLVAWLVIVKPANDVPAAWTPGPIPQDFEAIRVRWETGHMIMADINSPDSFRSHLHYCPSSAPELCDRAAEDAVWAYLTPLPQHPRIGELQD
jgi:hypothetical protein